jgi:flagellar protein FlaF
MDSFGLNAYKKIERTTSPPRKNEARVLTEGALKLRQCQDNWKTEDRNVRLHAALEYNRRIWSIFQSELLKADNALPMELRKNLLSLSVFIDKQIFKAMAYPSPEILNPIIDVNMGIAKGLRMSPDDESKAPVEV